MGGKGKGLSLWPFAWAALCIVAACIGVATRMSYSHDSANFGTLENLAYAVTPYSVDVLERSNIGLDGFSAEGLEEASDLVVLGSIGGMREYIHKSFLTDFEVKRVIKGGYLGESGSIKVFEPVGIYERPDGKVLVPGDAYMLGGTLMRPGTEYVLFLKRVADSVGIDGYTLLGSSPYSKVSTSDEVAYRISRPGEFNCPLREYSGCDVVVTDEKSLENYECDRRAILDFVGE